jgi:aminoglycoside phosphotransferase (APT) family kinase protein
MIEALAEYLTSQNESPVEVHSARRLPGGHSRAMFDVDSSAGRFLVRIERGGVFGTSSESEVGLMQSLSAAGFSVQKVRWFEPTGKVLGQPFFVMDHIDADSRDNGQPIDEATAASYVRSLAALHALEPTAHLPAVDLEQSTHILIEHWRNVGKSTGAPRVPLLDAAEMWLHQRAPATRRLSLVHGDAGPSNAVSAGGEVIALTDWEFAHVGDPAEDWANCMSLSGSSELSAAAWRALFEREAGVKMTNELWEYWEAFNLYKAACADRSCLGLFASGRNRSPDVAIIGTARHHMFLRRLVDLTRD